MKSRTTLFALMVLTGSVICPAKDPAPDERGHFSVLGMGDEKLTPHLKDPTATSLSQEEPDEPTKLDANDGIE